MKICSVCQRCYEDNVLSCIEENHHTFENDRSEGREIISGFRLDLLLESGISSKTYKATNTELNESCLIKIMTAPAMADGQKLNQQFLNEAQLIAAVNHPHLVHIYKFGILASGEFYLVTEEVG